MHEAVEIAKLRLFLKLVATVDVDPGKNNFGLEPLPDIDFNIRAGNTLVGYATELELKNTLEGVLFSSDGKTADEKLDIFKEEFELVSKAYGHFQNAQLINDQGSDSFKAAKAELNKRLKTLNHKLNVYLATNYGIDAGLKPDIFKHWLTTHQPFHWFAEFYQIVSGNGGFDVIIGNPPYVEYSKIRKLYSLQNYASLHCGNLYAFILERSLTILNYKGKAGSIIPLSFSSSARMKTIQRLYEKTGINWISNLEGGTHPSVIFEGVTQNLCIAIISKCSNHVVNTTRFIRCYSEERFILFNKIEYFRHDTEYIDFGIPKISTAIEKRILSKLFLNPSILNYSRSNGNPVYVHRIAGSGYVKSFDFVPFFQNERYGEKKSDDYKLYKYDGASLTYVGIYNSSVFYSYWEIFYDAFKVGKYSVENFPFPKNTNESAVKSLNHVAGELMDDMKNKSEKVQVYYKNTGLVEYDRFFPRNSKDFIDKIDEKMAVIYGFDESELDFIVNYNIKYRMSKEEEY